MFLWIDYLLNQGCFDDSPTLVYDYWRLPLLRRWCTAFTFKSRDRMCAIRPSPTVWSGSWRHQIGLTCWSFSKLRLSYDVHILLLGRCDRLVFVLQCGSRSAKYIFECRWSFWILYSVFCSRRITYCFFSSPNQLMWWWYSILTRLFFKMLCEAALKH